MGDLFWTTVGVAVLGLVTWLCEGKRIPVVLVGLVVLAVVL